ncbi:MAG: hypothetical protein ACK5QU_14995 [Bacteroidota bacterium]
MNRIGNYGNDIDYSGDSMVINPLGEVISNTKAHQESVETLNLNLSELLNFRKSFPANEDADSFLLNVT